MNEAAKVLSEFGIDYELTISSAHRSPQRSVELVENFHENGGKIIICGAGLAAHLAGVVASFTTLPVIGIPTKGKNLDGMDSLLSTVQMPPGVPVATVGIDAAKNAGLLAVQILSTADAGLRKKMEDYKSKMSKEILGKDKKLQEVGYKKYLEQK